ncbi:MAG: oligosaccharide flippase family protein [Eubacteriales bacterium]|nr:oligosaccharide flippase family protein [Eubacteriales bacterium]
MWRIRKYFCEFQTIFKNFSYNLSYQVLSLILPIITVPYITRVFTQTTVGLNTVIQANCEYFILFGMLGITLLGPREIAKCLGDRNKTGKTFFSIFKIQFVFHLLTLLIYIAYCVFIEKKILSFVYILYIISSMFDISWFYIGIEDFKSIAQRNIFVKLVSFICLFIFVRQEDHIYRYVCTLYIPQISINCYMWWVLLKKQIAFFIPKGIDKRYLKDSISLFVPQVASSIYTILDKTILGIFTTYSVAAIYAQGQILLRLFLAIVPSFCRVMVPRISSSLAQKNEEETFKYMKMSADVVASISFLLFFGVFACAQLFVDWYLPTGYHQTGEVIRICSPIILMVSGSNLVAVQYLIPRGEQQKYTISIFAATGINLVLNFLLTPKLGLYGVCIGSIIAETTGFVIQLFYVKKYLDLVKLFRNVPVYMISGVVMCAVLLYVSVRVQATILNLVLLAGIGLAIYCMITAIILLLKKKRGSN